MMRLSLRAPTSIAALACGAALMLAGVAAADDHGHDAHDHGAHGPAKGVADVADAGRAPPAPMMMRVDVVGTSGDVVGQASLIQGPRGVVSQITMNPGALTPGWHGLHLHAVGDCSDPPRFMASGGHVGLVAGGHGLLNPLGPEAGDLPNIYAFADGSAAAEF